MRCRNVLSTIFMVACLSALSAPEEFLKNGFKTELMLAQAGEIMNQPIKTIDPTQLKACLNNNGIIALVFVKRADVFLIGTRSEWVDITVMVEQEVHGSLSGEVQLRRYTSGGDTVLREGKRYIVAVTPVTRFAPRLSLEGFVEVPDGMEADYIDSHRRAVKKLNKE